MIRPFQAHGKDATLKAFDEIYERRFSMIYRVCYSYMRNTADTEDMVADVFEKLLRSKVVFNDLEHEKAWLLRTAINRCKDVLKGWWRSRANLNKHENIEAVNPSGENEIMKIILDLPERYKDVIYLYYYEGYSTAEVAQILKKPQSTVRNYMSEARKLLKGVLENEE